MTQAIHVASLLAGEAQLSPTNAVVQEQTALICEKAGIRPETDLLKLPPDKLRIVTEKLALARPVVLSSRNR